MTRVDNGEKLLMNNDMVLTENPYEMKFDIGTIKHLGLQMYSTLPPVIGELVANAWDANATEVKITIPEEQINQQTSEIIICDNGIGMSDEDVRSKYLIIGRDRRDIEQSDKTPLPHTRKVMGRKGIGKFSAFGIAKEIVVESVKEGTVSHFRMNYDELLKKADERIIELPRLPSTETVFEGTKITLKYLTKFKNRRIPISTIRRGLARRFAVIGAMEKFEVVINGVPISPKDRDFKRLLEKDADGKSYIWKYPDVEIEPETDWKVSGWIGALNRTSPAIDGIDRGIVLMARGKLVQEPFVFDAVVGQQYALSYLIGELHIDFVDEGKEDSIGTTRNSLVWDTEPNISLKNWGQKEVNRIAREWSDKRNKDNERMLQEHSLYGNFKEKAAEIGNKRAMRLADQLIRQVIKDNPVIEDKELEPLIQMCLDFLEFDTFWEIAENLAETELEDIGKILELFREWQIVEAKEMEKVTRGRIKTIEKLQTLIEENALEVPTLHNFLKEFPWVIDPRWTLIEDELTYSQVLRNQFPIDETVPENNRRIDFLCVRESTNLVVVEIKRPESKSSVDELNQIEEYVSFMRDYVRRTTDPDYQYEAVTGYLLCGNLVDTYLVREKRQNLSRASIYIRRYMDLLGAVKRMHKEFLERYNQLQKIKKTNFGV